MTSAHAELDEVFARIDDAFFALDDEWRFTFLNDRAEEFLNVDREEVMGEIVWEEFEPAVGTTFQEEYERAMTTQEPVSFEEYYPPLDRWFEVNAYPSETGLSVYFRDVTDRVERERELERYETIFETAQDGIYVVDDGTFTMVNEAYAEMVGYDRAELLGSDVSLVVDETTAEVAATIENELVGEERSTETLEATLERADGSTLEAEATFALLPDGQRVAVVRNVTERKERERKLEQYERIVETVDDGVYAVNDEGRFVLVNSALCEMTGYDRGELLGAPVSILHSEDLSEETSHLLEAVTWGEREEGTAEVDMRRKHGETLPVEVRFRSFALGDVSGRCGVIRDVTEREAYERRLVALHDVARDLLRAGSDDDITAVVTEALVDILDVPAAGYYQYDPGRGTLSPARVVDEAGVVDTDLPTVPAGEGSLVGATFDRNSTRLVGDVTTATEANEHAAELGLRSAVFAPVGDHGVVVAASPEVDSLDEGTKQLVEIVATTAAVAAERIDHERTLRRQHERLAALSDIDSLIHGLSESLFELSSQSDIESQVCRRLAESDSYEFAWIGTIESDGVDVHAAAGAEGFLDDLPTDEGLPLTNERPDEMRVVRDIRDESSEVAWRDHAREYGYRSAATIPVVDGEGYGTLTVYADRVNAFDDEERDALQRLGGVVGHALTAIERDRKLQLERDRLNFMNRLLRHNLLNSLNVVSARLEFLEGRVDEEVAKHLDTATDRTEEMISFVETVRSLTRTIGDGQELGAVDIGEVLRQRVERARSIYPDAEYHLEAAPSVDVVADDLLGEVLDNVLVNAVQHNTRDDPKVWVGFALGDEEVVVSVADNGPGIPDERKERLFDRGSTGFDDPASGFGLFLVAQVLESYGGDIAVADNDPEGTVFRLTFQRA